MANLKRDIKIRFSGEDFSDNSQKSMQQWVNYCYVFEGNKDYVNSPIEQKYNELIDLNTNLALNFKAEALIYNSNIGEEIKKEEGIYLLLKNENGSYSFYKKETSGENQYSPVKVNTTEAYMIDYNIANNREYEYIVYSSAPHEEYKENSITVKAKWNCWSITELEPVLNSEVLKSGDPMIKQEYKVDKKNVWLFKYNISTGEQVQNIVKTEQPNLSTYPRFSHGLQNNISGSVSCLLGRDILPYNFYIKDNVIKEEGGYIERLPFEQKFTSNEKVDMLNAWRKIIFSKNPKLLKDRKGQKFLIQITSGNNKPNDIIGYQPDTISFNWVQIGSLDNVTITGV